MSKQNVTKEQFLGQDDADLVFLGDHQLHRDSCDDWLKLQMAAKAEGFDLAIASAYRSYDRQMHIWNAKARGERSVLDSDGVALVLDDMSDDEIVFAMLRWSALPGASRHHWGTDIDVYDASSVSAGYKVQLVDAEVVEGGVFAPMHNWLDEQFALGSGYGFYRPYTMQTDGSVQGIAPERWHLSHAPVSQRYEQAVSKDELYAHYSNCQGLLLKSAVLRHFDVIYERYVVLA